MKKFYHFLLKMLGWTIEGGCPEGNKFIIIQAPHTSLWDFVYMPVIFEGNRNQNPSFSSNRNIFSGLSDLY